MSNCDGLCAATSYCHYCLESIPIAPEGFEVADLEAMVAGHDFSKSLNEHYGTPTGPTTRFEFMFGPAGAVDRDQALEELARRAVVSVMGAAETA